MHLIVPEVSRHLAKRLVPKAFGILQRATPILAERTLSPTTFHRPEAVAKTPRVVAPIPFLVPEVSRHLAKRLVPKAIGIPQRATPILAERTLSPPTFPLLEAAAKTPRVVPPMHFLVQAGTKSPESPLAPKAIGIPQRVPTSTSVQWLPTTTATPTPSAPTPTDPLPVLVMPTTKETA